MPKRWCRLGGVVLVATLLGTRAGAQNLVANGDFDQALGLASWTSGLMVQLEWSPDDWKGDPASGSARMTNAAPCASTQTLQCLALPLPLAQTYELGAAVYLEAPPSMASAQVDAVAWAAPGCQTELGSFLQTGIVSQQGAWTSLLTQGIALPPGTQSVSIRLIVTKLPFLPSCTPPQPNVAARFDHVRFGPTGTTPVVLQSFAVE